MVWHTFRKTHNSVNDSSVFIRQQNEAFFQPAPKFRMNETRVQSGLDWDCCQCLCFTSRVSSFLVGTVPTNLGGHSRKVMYDLIYTFYFQVKHKFTVTIFFVILCKAQNMEFSWESVLILPVPANKKNLNQIKTHIFLGVVVWNTRVGEYPYILWSQYCSMNSCTLAIHFSCMLYYVYS